MTILKKHKYKYFMYENELARREVEVLLNNASIVDTKNGYKVEGKINSEVAARLTYYASYSDGEKNIPTKQATLELSSGNATKRQSTRYSAHGLHEYKGKFNPQIVRAMLNILNIPTGSKVLDPFCGSGTSLLECKHMGMNAMGRDINPLAVFIANAKLKAIEVNTEELNDALNSVINLQKTIKVTSKEKDIEREKYLLSWFDPEILETLEKLRTSINKVGGEASDILIIVASNLLRDYSQQDPQDLRIRRRKTPLPDTPFMTIFERKAKDFIASIERAQQILGTTNTDCQATLYDSRHIVTEKIESHDKYDCAITSPPYATALPYIDTQRLSLVWLGLVPATEIRPLESRLIGSREVNGNGKKELLYEMTHNKANLPSKQANYCQLLQNTLSDKDGFRRQAVPLLLYRYFVGMKEMFESIRPAMKYNAPFALIVGGNHTILSGKRFDIDTPTHIAELAADAGWFHEESIQLQTYQRYGYHMNNAVSKEAMVILRAR